MLKRTVALGLSALVLAACEAPHPTAVAPAGAQFAAIVEGDRMQVPISSYVNICGTMVRFEGTSQLFVHTVTTKNSTHVTIHSNTQGVHGRAEDGTRYTTSRAENLSIRIPNGEKGPFVVTSISNGHRIGQGDAPDLKLQFRYHITVLPDGRIAVQFLDMSAGCSGSAS